MCLAFQSHFRILAWARLPLMPDLTREHEGLRSAQATRAKAPWSRMTDPATNTKWIIIERSAWERCVTAEFRSRLISSKPVSG